MTPEETQGKIAEMKSMRQHLLDVTHQCNGANISEAAPSGLFEDELAVAIWLKTLRRECSKNHGEIQDAIIRLEAQAKTAPLVEHIVEEMDTPQLLSLRYYGTPHEWPKILAKNRKTTTTLTVGEKLVIPQ